MTARLEFEQKMRDLFPDIEQVTLDIWQANADDVREICPEEEYYPNCYENLLFVAQTYSHNTAYKLAMLPATHDFRLDYYEIREAGRLVEGGTPLKRLPQMAVDGHLDWSETQSEPDYTPELEML